MISKSTLCVITGTRAEYGLLYWLMKEICASDDLQLQLIATGMHLSPEYGLTYRHIETDGFRIDAKVDMLLSSDEPVGITKSMGLGVIGFADAFARLAPDVVVVLGDRYEILSAAQAALIAGISVAHISGGEVSEGAIDDCIRHCITKIARYHFVAAEAYRSRVIQLGEHPDCVFNVGDPALDNIRRLPLLSRTALASAIGFDVGKPYFLVTLHPTTTGSSDPSGGMAALLAALDEFQDTRVVLTKANADAGSAVLNTMVDAYAARHPGRVLAATTLGQLNYLSAMKHALAVIGNSSSGIVEAPAMGVPTVNVGERQRGRLKATSIIDCAEEQRSITHAIQRATSRSFRDAASRTVSLYGDCNASTQIVGRLREVAIDRRHAKRFYDLPA